MVFLMSVFWIKKLIAHLTIDVAQFNKVT